MADTLCRDDIIHVARLARLALTDAEIDRMERHLNNLLKQIDTLQELETEGVEPTAHSFPVYNVFRDDLSNPSLTPDQVLANAPESANGLFIVPRIVEG